MNELFLTSDEEIQPYSASHPHIMLMNRYRESMRSIHGDDDLVGVLLALLILDIILDERQMIPPPTLMISMTR